MTTADYDPLRPPADPWATLDALRMQCPAHLTPSGMVLAVGFDAVAGVLGDGETFSSSSSRPPAPGEVEQLLHLDGEPHTRMRRLVVKALPKRVMAASRPTVELVARELLEPHLDAGELDVVSALSQPLPAIVFFRLLGLPESDRIRFLGWADDAVEWSFRNEEAPSHPEFMNYIHDRIAICRANRGEDILSRLVHTEIDGDRLSDAELAATVRILILAGTETTTNAMSTMFHQLLAAPQLWKQVKADEALRAVAVEEALRIDPPLTWVPRRTAHDTDVFGLPVGAHCVVAASVASANHDPAHYADPHTFRLDRSRSEPTIMTFGFGSHYCLGAPLARTELRAGLDVVIELLDELRLAADYEFAPRGPVMMRGADRLPVRFSPRR